VPEGAWKRPGSRGGGLSRQREGTEFEEGFRHIPAGARLGDWRVLRMLGQGRFGRVYEATYERPEGTKAAKTMPGRAAL
jgi:hypothetical protein